MITRERLVNINGLSLSRRINLMDDLSFKAYCNALNLFIDTYPGRENEIKYALQIKDIGTLKKTLRAVSDLLILIYADDLAQHCEMIDGEITSAHSPSLEDRLSQLLTAISGLSIQIQMAFLGETLAANAEPSRMVSSKTILAVDDVPLVLNTLNHIVSSTAYRFIGFTSCTEALDYLSRHTPDLFILDIEMPIMDGYTLAQEIRDRGHISPIIFLTGNATKDYVFKAIQAGAADFVVKPVIADQVLEKIERFMQL